MRSSLLALALVISACRPGPGPDDGGTGGEGGEGGSGGSGGGAGGGNTETRRLGMNDATVLVPLPANVGAPVVARASDLAANGTALIPDALFQRVIKRSNDQPDIFSVTLADFHVVAVRFDLCDRQLPWPCAEVDDARLRVVFQPLIASSASARDIALHAFYEIPNGDVADAVQQLRALARVQGASMAGALTVSPALTANPTGEYATMLKALVLRYANTAGLRRLTFFAQPDTFAQIRWVFRGLEGRPPNYGLITIAGAGGTEQDVILEGTLNSAGYSATPFSDDPLGLGRAIDANGFAAGTTTEQQAALHALTSVNNPVEHTPGTVQCVACHVATLLSEDRAQAMGTAVDALPGSYASTFNLSIAAGKSATNERFLRALGWLDKDPLISQRVVNETAQTLTEIQARFPVR